MQVFEVRVIGVWDEFEREWCHSRGDKVYLKDPDAFGVYMKQSGMMRRTREEVGRQLPPIEMLTEVIPYDPEVLREIEGDAVALARIIMSGSFNEKGQAAREFDLKLRQATGLAKAPHVASFIRMMVENGEKVVVAGWHRSVYDVWMEQLADLNPVMFTGSESPEQKDKSKRKFLSGESDILLMSLRSGAGLDGLQEVCSVAIIGELDWAPACLSTDTEVLTQGGFRGVDEVSVGDVVCGFDVVTGKVRWVPATAKVDRPLAEGESMYECRTEKLDLRVTNHHRMVVRRSRRTLNGTVKSPWEFTTAEELAGQKRRFVPRSGRQDAKGVDLTDHELRLIGWFLSDGHFSGRQLMFYQAQHQPWNEDLVEVLNGCGLKWALWKREGSGSIMNHYVIPKGTGSARWTNEEVELIEAAQSATGKTHHLASQLGRSGSAIRKKLKAGHRQGKAKWDHHDGETGWSKLELYLDKDLSPLLEGVTRRQLDLLLQGVFMGDGSKCRTSKYPMTITNCNKTFLDRLQSLCVRHGFGASIIERKSKTRAGRSAYSMHIWDEEDTYVPGNDKGNVFARCTPLHNERVWCLSNELETLVVRRNGKVAVVGNCHTQFIGRLSRDGQDKHVTAFFLLADGGSDPLMCEILCLKRNQSDRMLDQADDTSYFEGNTRERVKEMAAKFLAARGITVDNIDLQTNDCERLESGRNHCG
jgi:hypothetical protein